DPRPAGLPEDIGAYQTQTSPLVVNTTGDGFTAPLGTVTLRSAINLANALGTPSHPAVITFDPTVFATPQTITLTAGELLISGNAGINGPSGAAPLVPVNANGASRVFDIEGGTSGVNVTLENLAITGGVGGPSAPGLGGTGGGVFVSDAGGTVTL